MLTPPSTAYPFTVGSDTIALPPDLLEPKLFLITGVNFQTLTLKTPDEIVYAWSYDANGNRIQQQPLIYYFNQSSFCFDSPADQAYPTALIYFQQPAMLGAANLTNFLTQYCQRLLRIACMLGATEWTKEMAAGQYDRTYWEQLFEQEAEKIQEESDRSVHAMVVGAQFTPTGPGQNWSLFG